MRPRWLNTAVFILSGVGIAYQVVLMRVFSIAQWHHFAYMVISIAMLGFGASGALLAVVRPRLESRLALWLRVAAASFALSLVRLYNAHPSGAMHAGERLEAVMGNGGVEDCGKAQNCVEVCPKEIPLVDSIAEVGRATTKRLLFGWLLK